MALRHVSGWFDSVGGLAENLKEAICGALLKDGDKKENLRRLLSPKGFSEEFVSEIVRLYQKAA